MLLENKFSKCLLLIMPRFPVCYGGSIFHKLPMLINVNPKFKMKMKNLFIFEAKLGTSN